MKYLSLTALTLLTTLTLSHAQETKIDMHGGKENKVPSKMTSVSPVQKSEIFYGKVLEIKSAMTYTYLKIDENGTQLWIAIANAPVEIGDRVGYDKQVMMTNFKSKSLNQEFKEIYFASDVYLPQKISAPKSMKEMLGFTPKTNDAHTSIEKETSTVPTKTVASKAFVKKDSYTIEEIHMWRTDLKNQTITINATATKVSHAIMKRDWIHLSDDSGSEMMLNNDLVFTATNTSVKVGDKVTAKGKVIVDKDFGYGYFYKVIIEDATFEVK